MYSFSPRGLNSFSSNQSFFCCVLKRRHSVLMVSITALTGQTAVVARMFLFAAFMTSDFLSETHGCGKAFFNCLQVPFRKQRMKQQRNGLFCYCALLLFSSETHAVSSTTHSPFSLLASGSPACKCTFSLTNYSLFLFL